MNSRHMLAGELFPDRIGFGGWEVDDHEHQGITAQSQHPTKAFYVAPYSVPLRSLVAGKAASNLFLAGRILSVSRLVFLSLRVQCTLGALGQAAGTAAVRSLVTGRTAVDLTDEDVYAVQQSLLRDDCFIPAVSSSDPLDYARNATAVASSEARLALEPDFGDGASAELKLLRGQIVPVSADRIDTVELYLENRDDAEKPVEITAYPARDMWDLDVFPAWRLPQRLAPAKPEPVQIGRAVAQLPGNYSGWTKFELNAKVKPGTLVWLLVSPTDGVAWRFSNSTPPGTIAAAPGSRADSHATTEDWWEIPPGRMACPFHSRGLWRSHAVRISPESTPFGAQNVLNGVSRPDAWSNAWVSDPEQAFLQTIDIDLGGRKTISSIALSFDNNLNRTRWRMPAFWRAPECVRDFAISVKSADSDSWMEVASVTGNYQRHRVIAIPKTAASHLRLTIHATNGEASATVYEIRVY
jgi:hypothetical protein